MNSKILKTDYQIKKQARELAIYKEWKALIQEPGAMATAVDKYLMNKYDIHARSTIWFIRNRVEKRLSETNNNFKNTKL